MKLPRFRKRNLGRERNSTGRSGLIPPFNTSCSKAVRNAWELTQPVPIKQRKFKKFSYKMRDKALRPLEDSNILVCPSLTRPLIPALELLDIANLDQYRDGFTIGTASQGDAGQLEEPLDGHCVTLPGTDYVLPETFENDGLEVGNAQHLQNWLDHLVPVLETGLAWLGGYRWKNVGTKEKMEVNVTVVFTAERLEEAKAAGNAWDQYSIWTYGVPVEEGETVLGGTGGNSIYNNVPPGVRRFPD